MTNDQTQSTNTSGHRSDPKQFLFLTVGATLGIETLLFYLFHSIIQLPVVLEISINGIVLIALLYPILQRLFILPLTREMELRQKAEDELRLRSTALESAENSIFITDPDGVIEWINPSFTRLTGFSGVDAIGKTPRILKSGKMNDEYYRRFWQTILAGTPMRSEVINKRKDGSLYTVDQTVTPVKNHHEKIIHYVAIHHDISDRKSTDDAAGNRKV